MKYSSLPLLMGAMMGAQVLVHGVGNTLPESGSSWLGVGSTYAGEAAAVKYTCPMHPQIISDRPGTCPICGMALVPMADGHNHAPEETSGKPVIEITAQTIQKMGVRTEKVSKGNRGITIPVEAVLRSSTGSHVIMALGDGKFQARDVETGTASDGRVEVLSGLSEGDAVVTSSQFLIDSESSLRESLQKLSGDRK
ncbi:MAG: hypothetical protein J0L97_05035 [Alphaproteobacteria bacterium]|nr:hypothetical protein [Alphaproteobacteria bacterium]